jgi:hypothetical protein
MAMCRKIVAASDGELWAWDTLTGGTIFCVALPVHAPLAPVCVEPVDTFAPACSPINV